MELIAGRERCCEQAGRSAGRAEGALRGAFVLFNDCQVRFFKSGRGCSNTGSEYISFELH